MFDFVSRRSFLGLAAVPFVPWRRLDAQSPDASGAGQAPASTFPAHDPAIVKETVGASHGNLARVKELVSAQPALARASWDWGYGDWESAIDAASHVGNRPIAEFLIANGARPTIYTAAMMGQRGMVKGWIEALPGVQRNRGPHGITLVAHARAGGAAAAEVLQYLEALGDADPRYMDMPLANAERASITGTYGFGPGPTDRMIVASNARGLAIQRPGQSERNLFHQGGLVFNPAGAEAVKIRFTAADGKPATLSIEDGSLRVVATRLGVA